MGLAFIVGYQKHWPSGGVQEIPIRCYATGADRMEKLQGLKAGDVVLVKGEVTENGAVYAYHVVPLSTPERESGRAAWR